MTNFTLEKGHFKHDLGGYLTYLAMGKMSRIMLGDLSEHQLVKELHILWQTTGNRFSHEHSFSVLVDGKQVGAMTCMTYETLKSSTKNTVKQVFKIKGTNTFKLLFKNYSGIIDMLRLKECEPDEYHISMLATSEDYRGMGIASSLLDKAVDEALNKGFKKLSLTVDKANHGARRLYAKKGFIIVQDSSPGSLELWRMVKEIK